MKPTAKQIGIILLASAILAGAANLFQPQRIPWIQDWSHQVEAKAGKQNIRVIPLSVARDLLGNGQSVFIDARSADEYAKGHIPGALSIPFESLDEQYETLFDLIASGSKLVVYCSNRECDDALLLASELKTMGAVKPELFIDGFEVWAKYGGEVEQ